MDPVETAKTRKPKAREYYDKYKDKERPLVGGGVWQPVGSGGINGYFTSAITGRTFAVFNQPQLSAKYNDNAWMSWCNRCAMATICSGYSSMSEFDVLTSTWTSGAGYSGEGGWSKFGMTRTWVTYSTATIKETLLSGGYIYIYLNPGSTPNCAGGWTNANHWIAILGYREVDGEEQIFATTSGGGKNAWVSLNEFDGVYVNGQTSVVKANK